MGGDAAGEPLLGLLAQLGGLIDGMAILTHRKARQDRLMGLGPERAALGDVHRGGYRFRQILKQLNHFAAGLEAMLRGELAPVGFRNDTAFGDADQRVVGLVVLRGGEVRLIGRDQRGALGIGEFDQHRLGLALGRHAMALQFDIEPVAEQIEQRFQARRGERALPGGDRRIERTAEAPGERDHAFGLALQPIELEARRLVRRRVEEGARVEPHQAAVALLARRQQHDALALGHGVSVARAMLDVAEIDGQRAADNGLDAGSGELFGEFQRAEHVVGVGQRQRRLMIGLGEFRQLADRQRAFEQRIRRVHVQVHEIEIGHEAAMSVRDLW